MTFNLFQVTFVERVIRENRRTKTLILNRSLVEAVPGQFVMAWLPAIGERPFSIRANDPLAITITDVGLVSHTFNQLSEGDPIWIRGPLGKGFQLSENSQLLAGGGYGAAPLFFLAKQVHLRGCRVGVCLGTRTREELLMVTDFQKLGCQVYVATEDGSYGEKGLITDILHRACIEMSAKTIFACGPKGMLLAVAEFARNNRMRAQLSFEGLIRCGVGLCGSCELDEDTCLKLGIPSGFLVCHDGPVVNME